MPPSPAEGDVAPWVTLPETCLGKFLQVKKEGVHYLEVRVISKTCLRRGGTGCLNIITSGTYPLGKGKTRWIAGDGV